MAQVITNISHVINGFLHKINSSDIKLETLVYNPNNSFEDALRDVKSLQEKTTHKVFKFFPFMFWTREPIKLNQTLGL